MSFIDRVSSWIQSHRQTRNEKLRKLGQKIFDSINWLGGFLRAGILYHIRQALAEDDIRVTEHDDGGTSTAMPSARVYNVSSYDAAFTRAFAKRFPTYSGILLIVTLIAIFDYLVSGSVNSQFYGLLLNGIGSIVLTRAVVHGKSGMMMRDSNAPPGSNMKAGAPSLSNDSVDGLWGGFFLFIGYIVQLITSVGPLAIPF